MASSYPEPFPVAPDACRVWRGFKHPALSQDVFFQKLGSIFIPGTVQIQAPVGLSAYLPSVLPRDHHPKAPDEIALVFYEVQQAYDDAKKTVGGRAYSDLHALVFDLSVSLSGWPGRFEGELAAGGRYHLFDGQVDWQGGVATAFVGVRSGGDPRDFLGGLAGWLAAVQRGGFTGVVPDGAVASASDDYFVYWEHWPDEAAAASSLGPPSGDLVEHVYHERFVPTPMEHGLWEFYDGLPVAGGESFNFQFRRRNQGA